MSIPTELNTIASDIPVEEMPKMDMDSELSFAELIEQYDFNVPERGDVLHGHVLGVSSTGITVDVGAKRDGIVPQSDLSRLDEEWLSSVTVGDEVPVYVMRTPEDDEELMVSLSKGLQAQEWEDAVELMENGKIIELEVIGQNRGGLLVQFGHLRGFVPNSHVPSLRYINDDEEQRTAKGEMVGETLPLKVIEVHRRRQRLVMSAREATRLRKEQRMQELEPGSVVKGRVENLVQFGAFVDLGGVTGLIHVSKLAWHRVKKPSDLLSVGDEVEVLIEEVDVERGRISLNRQVLMPNPWQELTDRYKVGDEVEGVVTNVVDFGAFVQLPVGVEGLVHISEMPTLGTRAPNEIVKRGQDVRVRIIRIEPDRERVGLSLVAEEEPEPVVDWMEAPDSDAADETVVAE